MWPTSPPFDDYCNPLRGAMRDQRLRDSERPYSLDPHPRAPASMGALPVTGDSVSAGQGTHWASDFIHPVAPRFQLLGLRRECLLGRGRAAKPVWTNPSGKMGRWARGSRLGARGALLRV